MNVPLFSLYVSQGYQINMYVCLYVYVLTHICHVLRGKKTYFIPVHPLSFLSLSCPFNFLQFSLNKMFIFCIYTFKKL